MQSSLPKALGVLMALQKKKKIDSLGNKKRSINYHLKRNNIYASYKTMEKNI